MISWAPGKWQLDSMISWVTSLFEAMATGLTDLFIFFYLKQMTAGLTDLLSYFSTSGKWQLDLMISELQANDNWT